MPTSLAELDTILTRAGYRKYPKSAWIFPNAAAFYQKPIADDRGVMFFLDCYLFDYHPHDSIPSVGIEFIAHFQSKTATYRVIEYAKDGFNLLETEQMFLHLWRSGDFEHSST